MTIDSSLSTLLLARHHLGKDLAGSQLQGLELALSAFPGDANWQTLMREATASVLIDFVVESLAQYRRENQVTRVSDFGGFENMVPPLKESW